LTQPQVASCPVTAGLNRRVGIEGELLEPFRRREAGLAHPAGGTAPVPVVALGHQQLGEKPQVRQLLPLGRGGDLGEPQLAGKGAATRC